MARKEKVTLSVTVHKVQPEKLLSGKDADKAKLSGKTKVVFVPERVEPFVLGVFRFEALEGGRLYELPEEAVEYLERKFGKDVLSLDGALHAMLPEVVSAPKKK